MQKGIKNEKKKNQNIGSSIIAKQTSDRKLKELYWFLGIKSSGNEKYGRTLNIGKYVLKIENIADCMLKLLF